MRVLASHHLDQSWLVSSSLFLKAAWPTTIVHSAAPGRMRSMVVWSPGNLEAHSYPLSVNKEKSNPTFGQLWGRCICLSVESSEAWHTWRQLTYFSLRGMNLVFGARHGLQRLEGIQDSVETTLPTGSFTPLTFLGCHPYPLTES